MPPINSCLRPAASGTVVVRPDRGWETGANGDAAASAVERGGTRQGGAALYDGARCRDTHPLSDGPAGGRRQVGPADRLVGAAQRGHRTPRAAALPSAGAGRRAASAAPWSAGRGPDHLASRAVPGGRPGPTQCWRAECRLDDTPAVDLPGTRHRASRRHRNCAGAPASGRLRLQAADVEPQAQVDRTSRVGKKRLRVEAILAAAASPVPPPIEDLMPDPLLRDEFPEDLAWLLRLLPRADVYLQDEVEIALHPTLTRVWCRKGRRGQRLVEAPGNNVKEYGFGLVDWRDGWFDWERASGRQAAPFCAQLRRAVERSQARGRIALVLLDNLGIHTPKGSLLLRQLLTELRGQLVLVYTPTYDPESNRIEWLWRSLRRAVTHTHTRDILPLLLDDADAWARTISPLEVLRQIGSPFADASGPSANEELTLAA